MTKPQELLEVFIFRTRVQAAEMHSELAGRFMLPILLAEHRHDDDVALKIGRALLAAIEAHQIRQGGDHVTSQ